MQSQNKINTCYLCGSSQATTVTGKVRDRAELGIKKCDNCGLTYLDSQQHITADYYTSDYDKESFNSMSWEDYLKLAKDDDERRIKQIQSFVAGHSYLDVGCGAGGVVLGVKQSCKKAAAVEPMKRWQETLRKSGVEVYGSIEDIGNQQFDVITMFHVLEHLPDPVSILQSLKSKLTATSKLIIEVPNEQDALLSLYNSKPFSEFTYWSPHLYYFNPKTLAEALDKAGYQLIEIQQYQRYPLSNHMKWLSKGLPGGHNDWSFLDSPELTKAYSEQLGRLGKCDTLIAWVELRNE